MKNGLISCSWRESSCRYNIMSKEYALNAAVLLAAHEDILYTLQFDSSIVVHRNHSHLVAS